MATSIQIEYKQWLFISQELYAYFHKLCLLKNSREKQEGTNVIQHWLLVINENKSLSKYSIFPLLPKIRFGHEIADKLVNAIIEKKFFWKNKHFKSSEAVKNLLEFIDISHERYCGIQLYDLQPEINNGIIHYGIFSSLKFDNLSYLLKNYRLDDVTKMLLRYESLGNGSYQWGDPMELHLAYYRHYNVQYEGFASPINSRFLTLPNGRFCSLFPEIDSQFGSLGNFFDINLADYPGGWSINPPFVNVVLEDASKKVISALKSGTKSYFFCTYPYWKDCEGWKLLETSSFLVKKFHRTNGCVIQDAYGKLIHPPMGLSLFCLSYKCNNDFDIIEKIIMKETWILVTK